MAGLGPEEAYNLVTLCRACHDRIEALDAIDLYLSWRHVLPPGRR
jgi:hypothetical protein